MLGFPEPSQDRPTWALSLDIPDEAPFKGLELYAWQGLAGEECFALLLGTNYRKSMIDVVHPRTMTVGRENLLERMAALSPRHDIGWQPPKPLRELPAGTRAAFRYPAVETVRAIVHEAGVRHLRLVVLERRYWGAWLKIRPWDTRR
jgi:hypothetical protein